MQQFVYRKQILARQEAQKKKLTYEQEQLIYRLKRGQTTSYIEGRARELSLAKTNEAILIGADGSPTKPLTRTIKKQKPTYLQWKAVFLH